MAHALAAVRGGRRRTARGPARRDARRRLRGAGRHRTHGDARRRSRRSSTSAALDAVRIAGRHDVDVDVDTLTQATVSSSSSTTRTCSPAAPREALRGGRRRKRHGTRDRDRAEPAGRRRPARRRDRACRQRRATRAARRRRRGGPRGAPPRGTRPIPRSSSSCSPAPAATPASPTGSSARGGTRDRSSMERSVAEPEMTPAEVADLVTALAAELSPGRQAALTALSIGPALDDELLVALCDRPVDAAPALWHELRAAGLLVPDHEEPLPIVADAVATARRAATRRDLHRRIAEPAGRARRTTGADRRPPRRRRMRGPDVARRARAAGEAALAEAPERRRATCSTDAVDAGADPARSRARAPRRPRSPATRTRDRARRRCDRRLAPSRWRGPSSCSRACSLAVGCGRAALRSYGVISEHPALPDDAVRALGTVAVAAVGRARPTTRRRRTTPRARRRSRPTSPGSWARPRLPPAPGTPSRRAGPRARPPTSLETAGAPVVLPGDAPRARRDSSRSRPATATTRSAWPVARARRRDRRPGGCSCVTVSSAGSPRCAPAAGIACSRPLDAAAGPCTTRDALLRGALARRAGTPRR